MAYQMAQIAYNNHMTTYHHAIIGGTFDHFHKGHQALLMKAFEVAEKVSIGITLPEMYQDKTLADFIEEYDLREKAIKDFIKEHAFETRTSIVPLTSSYGSSLTDSTIDAIIVSPNTTTIAEKINEERVSSGLPKMEVITVPFVVAEDNQPISSERIRKGLITRAGESYPMFFLKKSLYLLPHELRKELQTPIGEILQSDSIAQRVKDAPRIVTVGDIVTATLLKQNILPSIALVDFKTQRKTLNQSEIDTHFLTIEKTLPNTAGTISSSIADVFLTENDNPHIIKIEGEEDLLTLPAILLSPLKTLVLYGQVDIGIVVVEVTEEKKEYIKTLLEKFN